MKSAIFLQMSYRFEWYPIFIHYLNLERTKGSAEQILRNRRHRAKNRILTLYRNDRLVHVHPRLFVIWRDALLFKMNDVGISGNIYNIIQNMYSNTFICIQKNNLVSDPIQTHIGVKQGDSLSSTLFNLYLHDFDKCFRNCNNVEPVSLPQHDFNHLLFADDLLLLSESNTGLQNCLNSLSDYCSKWKIQINPWQN